MVYFSSATVVYFCSALDSQPVTPLNVEAGYLSLKALSEYSNLGIRTLRKHLSHQVKPLPHYRVGGKILVRRSEFDEWVSTFRVDEANQVDSIVSDVLGGI